MHDFFSCENNRLKCFSYSEPDFPGVIPNIVVLLTPRMQTYGVLKSR